MSKIKIEIDGKEYLACEGDTILHAAKKNGINIPTLCHHEDLCVAGNCRVCLVQIDDRPALEPSCSQPIQAGMKIVTSSAKVRNARKEVISLLISEHNTSCTTCFRNTTCELQKLAADYNVDNDVFESVLKTNLKIDRSSVAIEKDDSKCIRCKRCVRSCSELQGVNAIDSSFRGGDMLITTFSELPLNEVNCVACGQCVVHCPTGALSEKRYFKEVWEAIADPNKYVIINTAPSVRATIGESFGHPPGTSVTGKMVAALRRIGFDAVLDTDFAADLTIMEEGYELLERLEKKFKLGQSVSLPMITSCSPGWVKFIEHMYPDHLEHLSTAKSPQQMFGAIVKTYYASKMNIDPQDIVCVAGMPCSAKKYEANRPEMVASGFQDINYGLTTREIAAMIKQTAIDFNSLEDQHFDSLMGESSGAGVIFGTTGGVMEAALRTVYEVVTGREVPFDQLNILPVRGLESIKEASIRFEKCLSNYSYLEGKSVSVAVAHGLVNARKVMDQIKSGTSPYHFVEIMACPGGCIGGGGSPVPVNDEIRKKRAEALYLEDSKKPVRKSHLNPEIIELYRDFLGHPLSEKAHKLLHTHYKARKRY